MTSSSSSKAAEMPEWRRNLNDVCREKLCGSQADLIRGMAILDTLSMEGKKGNFNAKDSKRFLKVYAGLLETEILRPAGTSVEELFLDDERLIQKEMEPLFNNLIDAFMYIAENRHIPIEPSVLPGMLSGLVAMLFLNVRSVFEALRYTTNDVKNSPEVSNELENIVNTIEFWLSWKPRWRELKRLRADAVLAEVGSKVTIDQLEYWTEGVVAGATISSVLLAEDRSEPLLMMLSSVGEFFGDICRIKDPYLLDFARQMVFPAIILSHPRSVLASKPPPSPAVARKIAEAKEVFEKLMCRAFKIELDAARAAVPVDHARIAYAVSNYVIYVLSYASGEEAPKMKLIEESKAALLQCRQWLPPLFYKTLKARMDVAKTTDGKIREVLEVTHTISSKSTNVKAASSMAAHCAGCNISGHDKLLKCCIQCKNVYYCSRECQKKDWKEHKKECKAIAANAKATGSSSS